MIYTNFSKIARQLDREGKAIFKDIGDAIAENLWEEFEILVKETAQYTGTTAASWNMYMQYRIAALSKEVRKQDERTAETALGMGHMHAVTIALNENYGRLDEISTLYTKQDIFISNAAPGASQAELGGPKTPRSENTGAAQAFARFESRIKSKNIDVIRSR